MFASSRLIALCTPNCKSLWIKASAKWLNVKCKCKFHGNDKATAQQLISEVETELPEIQKIIQMFINEGVKQSATFGYWLMFLNGADLLLRILRSEREAVF